MTIYQELRNQGHRVYTLANFADLVAKHDLERVRALAPALRSAARKIDAGKIGFPAGYLASTIHRISAPSPFMLNGATHVDRDGKRHFVVNLQANGVSMKVVHTVPVPQEEVA